MCFRCLRGSKDDAWITAASTVLVLGLQGSGKSVVLQQLAVLAKPLSAFASSNPAAVAPAVACTMPTIGTELVKLPPTRGLLPKGLILREVGGQMQPIWHHYYAEAAAVLFVVDVAAPEAIAEAAIELFDLLKQPQLQYKPFCVLLNKQDQSSALSRGQLDATLRLPDLQLQYPDQLQVVSASGVTGKGLPQLVQWLQQAAAAATAAPPSRQRVRQKHRISFKRPISL